MRGEEGNPGCCEWKMNEASVDQDVSTNVKQAAGIHSQQLLCSWDFPWMRQVPDSNIASTIQYDGSTWALFHFIHFSSIVIFIYYISLCLSLSLSLFLHCMSLSSRLSFFHFSWPPFCQHPQWRLFICCSDSVSLCKWNGIKWNVQFIVFRGFRIAMRHAQNKTKIAFPLPASV